MALESFLGVDNIVKAYCFVQLVDPEFLFGYNRATFGGTCRCTGHIAELLESIL